MKKSERQLLTLGAIGAGAVGLIALTKPSLLSGIFAQKPVMTYSAPQTNDSLRLYILGIPNERYLLTASASGGITIPTMLAQNKPYRVGPTGSLNVDLRVPAPSTVVIVITEMKTGRKITQKVPVDTVTVQQQVYFEFSTQEGRFR